MIDELELLLTIIKHTKGTGDKALLFAEPKVKEIKGTIATLKKMRAIYSD